MHVLFKRGLPVAQLPLVANTLEIKADRADRHQSGVVTLAALAASELYTAYREGFLNGPKVRDDDTLSPVKLRDYLTS